MELRNSGSERSAFPSTIPALCASAFASTSPEALALRAASQAKPWFPPLGFLRDTLSSFLAAKMMGRTASKPL